MPVQPEFQQRLQSIVLLLSEIETDADPSLREKVQELVQLVIDLQGAGFERTLEVIRATGDSGDRIISKLGRDELVASLLVLHGLHPLDLETRVRQALEKARSQLRAYDCEVELLSVVDGEVRLRIRAGGNGPELQALKDVVEGAIYQSAPDLTTVAIEGGEEREGFVPLEILVRQPVKRSSG